jgi:hypothetical protein
MKSILKSQLTKDQKIYPTQLLICLRVLTKVAIREKVDTFRTFKISSLLQISKAKLSPAISTYFSDLMLGLAQS